MGPAPAEVAGERLLDVGFTRVLAGGQERGGLHDHAVDAVAALHGLLIDEGLLHGMRPLRRAETFERDDRLRPDRRQRHHAGAHRLAVEMHSAGAALGEAAAEARAVESQVVAERVEQRHLGSSTVTVTDRPLTSRAIAGAMLRAGAGPAADRRGAGGPPPRRTAWSI